MVRAAVLPDQRPRFSADDYAYLRLLVSHYCPPVVPRRLRSRFANIWAMERAAMVHLMRVELEWTRNDIAAALKIGRAETTNNVALIEDLRDAMPWVDKIAEKLKDYRRGLL